jgi:hypothetical protein
MIYFLQMIHTGHMKDMKNFTGNSEEKGPLGRRRRSWGDNIKIDLIEIGYDGADWIHLAPDRIQ